MATFDDDEPQPQRSPIARAAAVIAAPISERTPRIVTLLAIVGGLGSLAPLPFGPLAAAGMAVIAWETGRRR